MVCEETSETCRDRKGFGPLLLKKGNAMENIVSVLLASSAVKT